MPEYNITVVQKNTQNMFDFVQRQPDLNTLAGIMDEKLKTEGGVWVIDEEVGEAYFVPKDTIELIEIDEMPPKSGSEG